MNTSTLAPTTLALRPSAAPWQPLQLAPRASAHTLDVGAQHSVVLQVERGRAWVTREGDLTDYFVDSARLLHLPGPARLHISAEGAQHTVLRWQMR